MSSDTPERTEADIFKTQYPGFTVTCDSCGSTRVTVENSLGFSALSGAWGEIALYCQDCHKSADIFSP